MKRSSAGASFADSTTQCETASEQLSEGSRDLGVPVSGMQLDSEIVDWWRWHWGRVTHEQIYCKM